MEASKQKSPVLKNLSDFEHLLKGYKPSQRSIEILKNANLVLLVGPTAAGRNTLMNLLVETGRYIFLPADTTRPPRSNNGVMEKDGVEYWFKSEEDFLRGLKAGKYIEASIIHKQQVSGTHADNLEAANKQGKVSLKEVEVNGASTYWALKPNIAAIFLLPPDFETWMQRLRNRGTIEEVELRRRLESAINEIAAALSEDRYYFVINHEIHEATVVVDKIISGGMVDQANQLEARAHAEQLAIDVQLYLNA